MGLKFGKWSQMPWYNLFPGSEIGVKVFGGDLMTVSYNRIPKGDPATPPHCHAHAQIAMFMSGEADVIVGDLCYKVKKNSAVFIPPNVPHTVIATGDEDVEGIDVFIPSRDEYVTRYEEFVKSCEAEQMKGVQA